jgi:hypothetical protein
VALCLAIAHRRSSRGSMLLHGLTFRSIHRCRSGSFLLWRGNLHFRIRPRLFCDGCRGGLVCCIFRGSLFPAGRWLIVVNTKASPIAAPSLATASASTETPLLWMHYESSGLIGWCIMSGSNQIRSGLVSYVSVLEMVLTSK